MGSSSSGNNYQDMFANSYYEDNATAAADSRAKYNSGGSDVSSLDMFSKQAKEEGVGLEGESSEATGKSDSSEAESSELASAPSAEVKADNAKGNSGKLNSSLGSSFNKMGASAGGTSGNSLKSMGGLSSGIGGSFASAKLKNSESTLTAMAQPVKAKTNAKKAALSKKSRSALAQAKYAAIKGKQALGSSTVTGGKSLASEAFVGETGSGDVAATEGAGMGLGGAGLSSGDSLKSNNPNLNTNESQIPDPGESEDASPWANLESLIQKLSMAAAAIYLIGTLLKKFASSNFIAMAHPFCDALSDMMYAEAVKLGIRSHKGGVYCCMEGPQFSTKAESDYHRKLGYDVIGMTMATEAKLAREAGLHYAPVSMITDYDAWKEGEEVSQEQVSSAMVENMKNIRRLLLKIIPLVDKTVCKNACDHAADNCLLTHRENFPPETYEKIKLIIE